MKGGGKLKSKEEIFWLILDHFIVIRVVNGIAYCTCPSHKDDKPSLHISMGEKKIILDCKAGCDYRKILADVGLKPEQLYYDYHNRLESTQRVSKKQYWLERYSQNRYDYHNINSGMYTHTKFRILDKEGKKQFPQGHYKDGVWIDGLQGIDTSQSVFCNGQFKQLQQAIQSRELICYTEGEKDCLTLWKYGYVAFTCGAVKTFKQGIIPYLKDTNVLVFGDADIPGRNDADRVAGLINTVGKARVIIPPDVPEKGDITDYMSNHTREDLQKLIAENSSVIDTTVSTHISVEPVPKNILVDRLIKLDAANKFPLTDIGSAMLFSTVFKDKHRYNVTAKDWFFYDSQRWILDREGLRARKSAKELSKALSIYAVNYLPDEDEKAKEQYLKYALTWTYSRTRNAIIQDSRDLNFISNEDLDSDDYTLNLKNCVQVFHGDRVEKQEHSADLLLSKIANAEYYPEAKCERWERFLGEVMQGDQEKIQYLQKLFGTCLTGDVRLEKMWFLFGASTRNGKSTLIERIADVLGDYSKTIRPETLAVKNNPDSRTASPDVAKLAGARLCVCSEIPKRMPLDVGLLKTLTGRDTIVARFLHQDEFQFVPKFKMICNTNFLPIVSDNTIFKSDRVQVVSFDRHFEESEQDKTLKGKLSTDEALSAILNWLIEGWITFCREGLEAPEAIKKSTTDYEASSDKLQNFINECLAEADGKNISVKDAYARYEKWCSENGYHVENKQNFISDCKAKGIFKERGMVNGVQVRNIIKDYEFVEEGFMEVDEEVPFK